MGRIPSNLYSPMWCACAPIASVCTCSSYTTYWVTTVPSTQHTHITIKLGQRSLSPYSYTINNWIGVTCISLQKFLWHMRATVLYLFTILTIQRTAVFLNVPGLSQLFLSILATYFTFPPSRRLIIKKLDFNSIVRPAVEKVVNDSIYLWK